ncbi:LPS assembly lipoprotein LptE [Litorimonas sp. WD9-15]|uniref:LPS assembly lipoprotein LptE n=1 Tax=Litorimonas sp. WD9-15 TaxID=3418716 RepID=UPI003D043BC3
MIRALFISLALTSSGLVLSGCGFTPVHQSTANGSLLQDINVQVEKGDNVADNQAGFLLTQRLRDRMGDGGVAPRYRLEIEPDYSRRRLGITDQDVASRYDITVKAKYRLYDAKSGDQVARGDVSSISTFGAPIGPYGVITADNVGIEQASRETADKVIRDLARFFANQDG